ncbi:MAG: hypothetical protein JNM83_18195 [Myxococcales bacterium]|nr:hypothetical protein [Myxococcales bacterium]
MRRTRPFLFALFFLALLECALRCFLPVDERVLLDARNPFGCFADDELLRLQKARESDTPALDVVLVGDSVLASVENGPGERLVDLLPLELSTRLPTAYQGRSVRVWSVSMSAARAADQLAALKILYDRLRTTRKGTRDLVVVVSSNLLFFSKRFSAESMNYPCLSYALADDGLLLRRLGMPTPNKGLWTTSDAFLSQVASHLYLFQQRRHLAEWLAGGPLRPRIREGLTRAGRRLHGQHQAEVVPQGALGAKLRNRPWFEREHRRESFVTHYQYLPSRSPLAWNWTATRALVEFLRSHRDLQTLVMVNPHNHFLIGPLGETPDYRNLVTEIERTVQGAGLVAANYDRRPELRSEHFLDIDHFTRDGNQVLSSLIATDVAALLSATERQ